MRLVCDGSQSSYPCVSAGRGGRGATPHGSADYLATSKPRRGRNGAAALHQQRSGAGHLQRHKRAAFSQGPGAAGGPLRHRRRRRRARGPPARPRPTANGRWPRAQPPPLPLPAGTLRPPPVAASGGLL